ncbi:MAG TPA: NUDIX domain-containing protein [Clostridiales bacterium]|nr:NUDIX domain-containing protein [Clostridiales bacterium]
MPKFELTNMIMIKDPKTGLVAAIDRIKSPLGLSLPGGHIEDDESFYDSAVREAYEETGLKVKNLKHCGVIHWLNTDTKDRYIVFLYKTSEFEGELKEFSDEGKNKWVSVEELLSCKAETRIPEYMPMFLNDDLNEAFGPWRENEDFSIYYK